MRSLTARKLASWMPILHWLPTYQKSWFRFDLIAGLTVWALVVPQAIAYAQIANLPPQAGVFASFAAPLAYALFGTSRQLIVSPTSATAALSASMVAPLVMAGDAKDFAAHSAALAILCGLGFIVLGRFRMGFLSQFIAPAVQAGFLIGLGLTIIVGQISKMLGIDSAEGPFYQQFDHLIRHLGQTNAWSMAIGLVGIASILTMRRLVPTIPMALVLVVLAIVAVSLFNLDERGVEVVGHVDRALPTPALPIIPLHDWLVLVPGVSAIVVIGYSESMSVTRRFANEHKYRVNPDQELVALWGIESGRWHLSGVHFGWWSKSICRKRSGRRKDPDVFDRAGHVGAALCDRADAIVQEPATGDPGSNRHHGSHGLRGLPGCPATQGLPTRQLHHGHRRHVCNPAAWDSAWAAGLDRDLHLRAAGKSGPSGAGNLSRLGGEAGPETADADQFRQHYLDP